MSYFVQTENLFFVGITIPANGGTGSQLRALIQAAGYMGEVNACIIDPWLAGTSGIGIQRPAFLAATPRSGAAIASTDFSVHGQYVPAGQQWYVPVRRSSDEVYVQSTNASTIAALVIVCL